jgi:hypothetical protein
LPAESVRAARLWAQHDGTAFFLILQSLAPVSPRLHQNMTIICLFGYYPHSCWLGCAWHLEKVAQMTLLA